MSAGPLTCRRCEVESKGLGSSEVCTCGPNVTCPLDPPCGVALLAPADHDTAPGQALAVMRDGLTRGPHLHHDGEHWIALPYVLDLLDATARTAAPSNADLVAARAWEEGYDARGRDIANEGLTYTSLTPNPYALDPHIVRDQGQGEGGST